MARAPITHGGTLGVKVEGLRELERLPGFLEVGQRRFLNLAADRIADRIAQKAPGGKHGKIGRSFTGQAISSTRASISSDLPAARALEKGAFITPRGLRRMPIQQLRRQRRRLKIVVDGKTLFVPFVRLPARGYAKSALRDRHKIVRAAFTEALDDLERNR